MKTKYIKANVKYIFSTTDQLGNKRVIELGVYPTLYLIKPKVITGIMELMRYHEFKLEEIDIHPELYQLGYSDMLRNIQRRTV